jgi:lipopolysaccharide cholinephosphotransferase
MMRDDYTKFSKVMQNSNSHFKLFDVSFNNEYFMPIVKVADMRTKMDWHVVKKQLPFGVWIDIFILDNVPDDEKELKCFQRKLNFLQRCYQHSLYKNNYNSIKSVLSSFFFGWTFLLGPRYFSKKLTSISQRYNGIPTRRFAHNSFSVYSRKKSVIEKEIIGNGRIVEFEKNQYLVPELIDEYLSQFYSDYMKLPPVEKRKSNHTADFFIEEEHSIS